LYIFTYFMNKRRRPTISVFSILMDKKFLIPRGTSDVLPAEIPAWQALENQSRRLFQVYNYKEIRTPVFEETELFARSMGQTSDVVQKQMLNLASQKADVGLSGLSLRPENTASVVRSYIQNSLDKKEGLSKLFYIGPMFRGERPQKGRLRQFHQIGVEAIGPNSANPYLDAEIIALAVKLLNSLGLKNFKLRMNTLGTPKDKENYSKILRKELKSFLENLPADIRARYIQNIFRILDSKDKDCKAAVAKLDIGHAYLSEESRAYFSQVKEALDSLNVAYVEDTNLVRGLDYYTHTVFEISDESLGAQDALGAGGRYGGLVHQLGGGEDIDAMGFALGAERILLALNGQVPAQEETLRVFIVGMDDQAVKKGFEFMSILRQNSIPSDMSFKAASMKSQMRLANKTGAEYVLILGEEELQKETATIKNMKTGEQEDVGFDNIVNYISGSGV
ncbi:MAG: histidine--tRNA ligase, partial [Candidatus Omnitrophica bacterium]|nr:histidine--tRNA ligase [Candidatus Omnitrophota bacterium]